MAIYEQLYNAHDKMSKFAVMTVSFTRLNCPLNAHC